MSGVASWAPSVARFSGYNSRHCRVKIAVVRVPELGDKGIRIAVI
jgi:hypothetical protein